MNKIILGIALLSLSFSTKSQNDEFFKSYRLSTTLWERSESVLHLQNGRLLDVGESSHCTGVTTCYNSCALIWFDPYGNMVRNRKIGSSVGFYGVQARECTNGSLVVHGNITNNVLFMKTDSLGVVTWSKTIDHTLDMDGKDIVQIDTTYFVTGSLGSNASQLYSFTESGTFRWLKSPLGADRIKLWDIVKTSSNTILGIAELTSTSTYYGAACLIEMDMNGNVLNSKVVTPSFSYYGRGPAFKICKASDGNYVMAFAYTNAYYVAKLNASLNVLWSVKLAASPLFGSGYHDSMVPDNDGGVWIGSHEQYSSQIEFLHLGISGNLLETNSYSNNDLIELAYMNYTPACDLVISGARRDGVSYRHFLASLGKDGKASCLDSIFSVTSSPASLGTAPYAVSMNTETVTVTNVTMFQETGAYEELNHCSEVADNCAASGIDELNRKEMVSVYPVPASEEVWIKKNTKEPLHLALFNALGEQVAEQWLKDELSDIPLSGLPSGIYFYKAVDTKGQSVSGKIIKN
jgi:hypothetical protein